jgi:RNA polymerase sigma-70 factor (ECF subfamily)
MVTVDSDSELASRCLGGNRDAFDALIERYYRPICAFLLRRVGRPDVVEDLAQDTFLEAYRSLKIGRKPERLSSWLFGIAVNCSGKWLRRKRPVLFDPGQPPTSPSLPSVADEQAEVEEQLLLVRSLETTLAELPQQTRTLLELKHREGKTCEEIAALWGQPVGTIKSQLSRAYALLRSRLGAGGDE